MSNTEHVRPGKDRVVYREDGSGVIPDDGERVTLTTYYRRRLVAGDLVAGAPRRPRKPSSRTARPDTQTQGES